MGRLYSSVGVAAALMAGSLALGGCATKKFVNESVAPVQSQVASQDAKLGELDKYTQEALARATAAGKLAEGKFLYSVVLSDDSVKFPSDGRTLGPEAEAALGAFVEKLKGENKNLYIEIQGHTDSRASDAYNMRLGSQRAEAVRRFLNAHGVALNRMNAISYGEAAPVAPNNTRAGRATNRRVALIVLS